jgi:squalene synthase HpnC
MRDDLEPCHAGRPAEGETLAAGSSDAAMPTPDAIMGKAGHENFPVAPWFLPREVRRRLLAVYGYARLVDDVGDEAAGDRHALLDDLEGQVHRLYQPGGSPPGHPLLRALAPTIARCGIPRAPLLALIEANRRDQAVHRYQRFDELLEYCELSANPVGHLVLHVFDQATPERLRLADHVCTALQLIEHWQDVAEDARRGRVYLPVEHLAQFGCAETDLTAAQATPALRRLLAYEVDRASDLLDRGAPLAGTLRGWARLAVAAFIGGGRATIKAIRDAGHDVLAGPPRPTRARVAVELLAVVARGR